MKSEKYVQFVKMEFRSEPNEWLGLTISEGIKLNRLTELLLHRLVPVFWGLYSATIVWIKKLSQISLLATGGFYQMVKDFDRASCQSWFATMNSPTANW